MIFIQRDVQMSGVSFFAQNLTYKMPEMYKKQKEKNDRIRTIKNSIFRGEAERRKEER